MNEVGEEAANIVEIIKDLITTFKKFLVFLNCFCRVLLFCYIVSVFLDTYAESDVINNYPGDEIPVKKSCFTHFF